MSGCVPALSGRPAWLVARQSPEYPAPRYLTGAGQASTAGEAERLAREDLIARLQAELGLELRRRAALEDPAGGRLVRPGAERELAVEPAGLRVGLTWQSRAGERFGALAVVERLELAAALGDQLEALHTQAHQALQAAQASAQQPYPGLLQLIAARLALAQAEEQRAYLAVVDPGGTPPAPAALDEPTLAAALESSLAALDLFAPAQGAWRAGQEGRTAILLCGLRAAHGALEPVPGVPVRFSAPPLPGGASAGLSLSARTDPAGLARVQLDASAGARLVFQVGLDGPAVLEEAGVEPADPRFASWSERISAPRASLVVERPDTPAGARVALLVAELRSGAFRAHSRAGQAMARALAERGLRPLPPEELDFALDGDPTPARVAAALTGQAELALYGVVQTESDASRAGALTFVTARGELWAVRLPRGEVLGHHQGEARGAGLSAEQATSRALDAFARQALEVILPALEGSP
jgi:hypothetical protein